MGKDSRHEMSTNVAKTKSVLEVNLATSDDIAVIGLRGDFVGSEVVHFKRACSQADKNGLLHRVIDLAEVDKIDGYGIAGLVGLLARLKNSGGRMLICGVNPELRRCFEATHCDTIFDTVSTVAKAVEKLKKGQDL